MKKITLILILVIINIFMFSNVILAYNLELILSADKTDVKVGDTVTVTLTLSKGMQAADFIINYDSNLLQFETASLGKNFYSTKEPGKIICSWFDTKDTTEFTFTFIAISSGTAKFTTTTENFYDGNLQSASSYNEGKLNITLLSSTNNIQDTTNIAQNPNQEEIQQIETKKEDNTLNSINKTETTNKNNSSTYTAQSNKNTEILSSTNNTLPQAGDNTILFITIILGLIILAVISKIKLNKLRDI